MNRIDLGQSKDFLFNPAYPVNPVEMFFDLLINSSVNTILLTSISEERYFNHWEH